MSADHKAKSPQEIARLNTNRERIVTEFAETLRGSYTEGQDGDLAVRTYQSSPFRLDGIQGQVRLSLTQGTLKRFGPGNQGFELYNEITLTNVVNFAGTEFVTPIAYRKVWFQADNPSVIHVRSEQATVEAEVYRKKGVGAGLLQLTPALVDQVRQRFGPEEAKLLELPISAFIHNGNDQEGQMTEWTSKTVSRIPALEREYEKRGMGGFRRIFDPVRRPAGQ